MEFTHDVVRLMQTNIRCVRGRRQREHAEIEPKGLSRSSVDRKSEDFARLFKEVLGRLERCLPGSNIYRLQPGGNVIKYAAATIASGMKGEMLPRGRGVSFDCIGSGHIRMAPLFTNQTRWALAFILLPTPRNRQTPGSVCPSSACPSSITTARWASSVSTLSTKWVRAGG